MLELNAMQLAGYAGLVFFGGAAGFMVFFRWEKAQTNMRHQGKDISRGQAIGLWAILTTLSAGVVFIGHQESGEPLGRLLSVDQNEKLKEYAIREIYESEYSYAGPGGICDKVEDARLSDVRIGTISRTRLTGELSAPIPAILARHDYVCVASAFAKKEREPNQWVILAVDKEFDVLRCIRTGPKDAVNAQAKACGFEGGPRENEPEKVRTVGLVSENNQTETTPLVKVSELVRGNWVCDVTNVSVNTNRRFSLEDSTMMAFYDDGTTSARGGLGNVAGQYALEDDGFISVTYLGSESQDWIGDVMALTGRISSIDHESLSFYLSTNAVRREFTCARSVQ